MFTISPFVVEWTLLITAAVSILLPILGSRFSLPFLVLAGRWLRWLSVSLLFAFCLRYFEISLRPDWVHLITGLAVWFLLETGYNWLAISAVSRSEIPLFPTFRINNEGDEWPADERLIGIKEWLRLEKFSRLSALKSEMYEGVFLRASIYESEDKATRIQILFVPKIGDHSKAYFNISTTGFDDQRLVSDNLNMPFGGYYPESWIVNRKPLIGSLPELLTFHRKCLLKTSIKIVPFEDDPLNELNDQQRILERLNFKTGFLVPLNAQEVEGRITYDGRYRLWKEMWLLAYLGKSIS